MKVFDKFFGPASYYRESPSDLWKKNLQSEINKKEKEVLDLNSYADLNKATLFFSRNQTHEKVNSVDEAFKLLNEMTSYIGNSSQGINAFELTKDMHFDTKKITAIFSS